MYIKKLENWNYTDWAFFFEQFPHFLEEDKEEVKMILTSATKEAIEQKFQRLKKLGLINGIGPGYFGNIARMIISALFRGVRYEWHDIMYSIGGTEADRRKADVGLLKYSIISLCESYKKLTKIEMGPIERTIIIAVYSVFVPVRSLVALFCYGMVRTFGGYWSFRFIS